MLLFSEYDRTLKNISISQPMVDVDMEDTNSLIIRYPKFKRVTHLILSYDAQNLFTKEKSGYGYFMDLENTLQEQEDNRFLGESGITSIKVSQQEYYTYKYTIGWVCPDPVYFEEVFEPSFLKKKIPEWE